MRIATMVCAALLGIGTAGALTACGEDRGGVEVEGGATTGGTAGATTPTTTTP